MAVDLSLHRHMAIVRIFNVIYIQTQVLGTRSIYPSVMRHQYRKIHHITRTGAVHA